MKVKLSDVKAVYISSEYIKLDSLLKYSSIVMSGGEAKTLIRSGKVCIDNEICTTRGKKIRHGDVVHCENNVLIVKQAVI